MLFNNDLETTIKAVNYVNYCLEYSKYVDLKESLTQIEKIADILYKEKVERCKK